MPSQLRERVLQEDCVAILGTTIPAPCNNLPPGRSLRPGGAEINHDLGRADVLVTLLVV